MTGFLLFSTITNDGQKQKTKIIIQPTFVTFVAFAFNLFA